MTVAIGISPEVVIQTLKKHLEDPRECAELPEIDMAFPEGSLQFEMEHFSIDYEYNVCATWKRERGGSDDYGNFETVHTLEDVDWGISVTAIIDDEGDEMELSEDFKGQLEQIITNTLNDTI